MSIRNTIAAVASVVTIFTGLTHAPARAQSTVTISTVPSIPSISTYIALEKGYFREAGVEVKLESIDSLSKAMALLATNQIQLAQGGINVGYFNAIGQKLPVVMALESGSTPVYHNFVVRTALKDVIRTPADLKGRNVAVSGAGSLSVYELAVLMESVGLKLDDVNVKQLSFAQMGPALASGALDVALMVAPFSDVAIDQKFAVPWIDPEEGYIKALPMTSLSYMASLDWIQKDRGTALRVIRALIRAGRDYCQAYHGGPNRAEVVDLVLKYGIAKDRAQVDRMMWQSRSPDGHMNPDSIADLYRVYKKEGLIEREPDMGKLMDVSLAAEAAASLGPFELINKSSPLKGCR